MTVNTQPVNISQEPSICPLTILTTTLTKLSLITEYLIQNMNEEYTKTQNEAKLNFSDGALALSHHY